MTSHSTENDIEARLINNIINRDEPHNISSKTTEIGNNLKRSATVNYRDV